MPNAFCRSLPNYVILKLDGDFESTSIQPKLAHVSRVLSISVRLRSDVVQTCTKIGPLWPEFVGVRPTFSSCRNPGPSSPTAGSLTTPRRAQLLELPHARSAYEHCRPPLCVRRRRQPEEVGMLAAGVRRAAQLQGISVLRQRVAPGCARALSVTSSARMGWSQCPGTSDESPGGRSCRSLHHSGREVKMPSSLPDRWSWCALALAFRKIRGVPCGAFSAACRQRTCASSAACCAAASPARCSARKRSWGTCAFAVRGYSFQGNF